MTAQQFAEPEDVEPSPAATEQFSIGLQETDGRLVMALTGDFDLSGRARFYEQFDSVRTSADSVALDVSGLNFVDTSGLGCLCYARNALFERTGRAPKLVGATPALRQLLTLSGLDDLFDWEAATN